ncbi:MAG: tetraacyldisaccharide 4'-kinase [Gammaproteobacteria bacterium]|nr:tetraacyldisaccharide 4'-kinase [Gammaproteobacteria bacterium]MCI0590179.1 tetraacyldisaccharide 4'-kinase [Gammaproteobacteria bacterium]
MAERLEEIWYGKHPLGLALAPLAWIYRLGVALRRQAYVMGLMTTHPLPVPVVVVGNITVGGTGKTPLVIWIANFLKEHNYKPGIVARGYGGAARHWPQQVRPDSDPAVVGDEALVLARQTRCPVAVGPDRYAAAEALIKYSGSNIIVSDDGLQHLTLGRDIEIAVIDGIRRHGNRRCLPAGPLREPLTRLKSVDLLVTNGLADRGEFAMQYVAQPFRSIKDDRIERPIDSFRAQSVHAIAAIGHPARFFSMLRSKGLRLIKHVFPDHHVYAKDDICFDDGLPVVMTEKDAVKCKRFAGPEHWYMAIEAKLPDVFGYRLLSLLKRVKNG